MSFELKVNGQYKGLFKTNQEALDHVNKYYQGKEAHTIHHEERVIHHDTQYDNSGNMVGVVIAEAWDETVPAWDEQVPAEYTYVIEDHTAEVEQERTKKETKHNDRVSRVDQLKAINWNTVDTVAELKAIVRILVKEAIKDDE